MNLFSILRKLPPTWSTSLIYTLAAIGFLWRFLVGTTLGIFFLSLALYGYMSWVSDTKPFTPSQLLLWLADLPIEVKTAISAAILTIVGFLVAFHTATLNWKHQANAQLRAYVAGELEQFYAEVSGRTIEARIYAKTLVEAVNAIQAQGVSAETVSRVHFILDRTTAFLATRQRLSAMSIEVHRILGKNYSLLATVWGAAKALEEANAAFSEIAQAMWIRVPFVQRDDPNLLGVFLAQVNVTECLSFVACCDRNDGYINGVTGGIRGLLLAPVVGMNLASLVGLLTNRAQFRQAIAEFYRSRRHER